MRSALAVAAPAASLEPVSCPTCGSGHSHHFIDAEDDLGGRPGRFTFVRCDACALVYQNPRIALEAIRDWYDEEYLAHRKRKDWGPFSGIVDWAMDRHDRRKAALLRRIVPLTAGTHVLDVGCGAGTFLAHLARVHGARVTGVDFKDLSASPWMQGVEFRCGLLSAQSFGDTRFDVITMWHFLEHDYEPRRTLAAARELLAENGRLVVEVPRLDSASFRLFKERWPGLQAPQHTALYSHATLRALALREGYDIVEHLPYGAFPAYFYLFAGAAFKLLRGKGLDFSKAVYPYFLGELLLAPMLLFEKKLNLAMQTIVLRKAA
jgi:SAM-dependent methyltransferase